MAPKKHSYEPDYAVLPGETIQELLEDAGMTQAELAKRMGRPPEQISRLINGHISIEPETAIQLERVLAMPASFWLNLQSQYDEQVARVNEAGRLQHQIAWAHQFPVKAMLKNNWIKPWLSDEHLVTRLLDYFGIASSEKFEEICVPVACRQSNIYQSQPSAIAAWIRFGQRAARMENVPDYNSRAFDAILDKIRALTLRDIREATSQTVLLAREAGVLVLFVPELPNLRLNGAVHWYSNHPIIQLTIRGKRDDILWFSFFHEAGHVLKHPKNSVFIESDSNRDALEDEADRFAADKLVSPDDWRGIKNGPITPTGILRLAEKIQVSPSIIAGRLFYEKILQQRDYPAYNSLFQRICWASPSQQA